MSSAVVQFDEMELDYQVEYREKRTATVKFDRSSRSQFLVSARHDRRSSPKSQNGIHRRGRKSLV